VSSCPGECCHHRLLGTPQVKYRASRNHEWKDAKLDGGPGKLIRHGRDQNASQGQCGHECDYGLDPSLHVKVLMPGW